METNLETDGADSFNRHSYRHDSAPPTIALSATDFQASHPKLQTAAPEPALANRIFDHIDYPYLIVDEDIRLIWANRAARQTIARSPDLEVADNDSLCAAGVTQSQWQRAFRDLDHHERTALFIGGSPAVVRELTPLSNRFRHQRQYLVALSKMRSCNDQTLMLVATKLGLTPSECKILLRLTAGIAPLKIAEERQVSESTVRAQIKAILAKFGCNSISSLLLETSKLPLDLA